MRDTLIFYRSFYEAINELPKETQSEVYHAIFEYSLNFNEVQLTGLAKTIFTLIKPQLEANNKRFANGNKPKVKQVKSETEAKQKRNKSKVEANNNNNNNDNKNNNENIIHTSFDHLSITTSEFNKLIELGHSESKIKDIFLRIQNYKNNSKYKSLYLTALNWLKDEKEIEQPKERFTPSGQKLIIPY